MICILFYYYNCNFLVFRGVILFSLVVVVVDERRCEIIIDFGVEVWYLKVLNVKEFSDWVWVLEWVSKIVWGVELFVI